MLLELYEAQHPPVQMDKNIKRDLKFCDQYCFNMLHRTVWGATPASSDGQKY